MKRLPTFNPHLRAQIRNGAKTETRRTRGLSRVNEDPDAWTMTHEWPDRWRFELRDGYETPSETVTVRCPYGLQVGDLAVMPEPLKDSFHMRYGRIACCADDGIVVRAHPCHDMRDPMYLLPYKWKPPRLSAMHMPTAYGRTVVRITAVELQRLQDITEEQAIAEGVDGYREPHDTRTRWRDYVRHAYTCANARSSFAGLWDSINGAGDWDRNLWTWRIAWDPLK